MPEQPNIILIILDTQRRDRLSAYGYTRPTSPEFDAFAANATLFERAISPAQWTIPAHASLFTGVYPTTHQLTQAYDQLSGAYPTLAEILQVEGYHTAAFCNNPLVGVLDNGLQRGFTDFFNYAGAAPNRPIDIQRNGVRRALATEWRRFAMRVSNQFAKNEWLFRVSLNPYLTPIWTRYVNYKGHTQRSIDDLTAYLQHHQQNNPQQPFFAFLNLMGTHLPYRPPQDVLSRFSPELHKNRDAYRFMGRFNADAVRWASPVDAPLSEDEQHIIDAFYDAEIAEQDQYLGELLRYLAGLDNTMVIIAADHGEGHGDHQFFGHSFVVYQELVHVPLVIYDRERFPQGKRIQTNISTRRIYHTVLDAAGVMPPLDSADPNANVAGLSLKAALNGKPDSESGVAFAEAIPPRTILSSIGQRSPHLIDQLRLTQVRRGIYAEQHKLAVVGGLVEGLFNVADDPQEQANLAPDQASLADDLQAKINHFVQDATLQRSGGSTTEGTVSDEVLENLRALGYIE